jgi:hypothetical protein
MVKTLVGIQISFLCLSGGLVRIGGSSLNSGLIYSQSYSSVIDVTFYVYVEENLAIEKYSATFYYYFITFTSHL